MGVSPYPQELKPLSPTRSGPPLGRPFRIENLSFFRLPFWSKKWAPLRRQLAPSGRPGRIFRRPLALPGAPSGSKNVTLWGKINDFHENDVEVQNDVFSYFWDPLSCQGLLWSAKRPPAISQKASLGELRASEGLQKRHFTMCFWCFS